MKNKNVWNPRSHRLLPRLLGGILVVSVATLLLGSQLFAQPRPGGSRPGGGPRAGAGSHPGGGLSSVHKVPFGDAGPVIHRDFAPPEGKSRQNLPNRPSQVRPTTPTKRPDLPKVPNRPQFDPGDRIERNIDLAPGGNIPRPTDRGRTGPVDLKPQGERPSVPTRQSGPDWKNWKNIDSGKIHQSVVGKVDLDKTTVDKVRNHFKDQYDGKKAFSEDWFKKHPDAWHPGKRPGPDDPHPGPHPKPGPPGPHPGPRPDPHPHPGPPPPPRPHFWWHHPSWNNAWVWFAEGFFIGRAVEPISYQYGSNIVYADDTVYINGVPYVSAEDYYLQAWQLASAESVAETGATDEDDWMSMGTFALVKDARAVEAQRIVQLATDKHGHIRGNLIDTKSEETVQVYGNVDSKTQRVAFMVDGNDKIVAECGLWNLTQDTAPLLVHVDENRTEERTLVRLGDGTTENQDGSKE